MNQPAVGGAGRLQHCFAHRRVAVDEARYLRVATFEQFRDYKLLNQFGRLRADDVCAEQLAVLFVADNFDEPAAVAVERAGADGAVRNLADGYVEALFLGLLFAFMYLALVAQVKLRLQPLYM